MQRRKFIKNTSILGSGLLFTSSLKGLPFHTEKPHVLIIGAGLAGLSAAHYLLSKGYSCEIFEARNRIGGRVFSHVIDKEDNLVVELGAEWVGASHTRIQELCGEFDLTLQDNRFETHLIFGGQYSPAHQWDYSDQGREILENMIENYHTLDENVLKEMDKLDWWRYLVNLGLSGRDLEIRELLDSTDFGESIRQVSAFSAIAEYAESSEFNEMDYKIKGGNQSLTDALANKIGRDRIHTGVKIKSIEQGGGKVRITSMDGRTSEGQYLICTAPTYSVLNIHWSPSLPLEKTIALNQLQYGRINKFVMLNKNRYWNSEAFDMVTDGPGHYFYHGTKNQASEKGALISYSVGEKAATFGSCSSEQRLEMAALSLEPAFGDIRQNVIDTTNYFWGSDAYSYGAYALYGPGQWFGLLPILREPFGRIFFAGEHLADWQGFMEGAISTGEEAAIAIIE